MKPILKQKCSEAYQEGYKKGMWMGFKQKKMAYESEIDCLKKIQFALYKSVPKWIPVTERLPEREDPVLCFIKNGQQDILTFDKFENLWVGMQWTYKRHAVTHWMPMPEPPQED